VKAITGLIVLLIGSYAYTQEQCSNFKTGVFYAEVREPFAIKWKVTRNGNQQIEEVLELPDEAKELGYPTTPQYEIIEWIDECTYRLIYDESKFELSETQKTINESGGAVNRIVKVEGKCHYYISTVVINGKEMSMEGKLCSE
jgi:hypothetical protein